LNHPHICQLYDVGSQDGAEYLVMEFLEGETLADRLRKGALPLGEFLKIPTEVAEALTVAHRAGIVHRDLKPGNIMLTKSGAKLMDFGLAKPAISGPGGSTRRRVSRRTAGRSPSRLTMRIPGNTTYGSFPRRAAKPTDLRLDLMTRFRFGLPTEKNWSTKYGIKASLRCGGVRWTASHPNR
jgi:serine/threonine protein kinase